MKHLGDITKINGYEAPSVDVIIGGSPCQDLSAAGKRAGLQGDRSGLFMEQIRIIKEMREASANNGAAELDLDTWFGKTCREHSAQTEEKISAQCLKKRCESSIKTPLYLDLRAGSGGIAGVSWETDSPWLGVYSTRSFGECPNVAVESRLSQILEAEAHPKYFLSERACKGVLGRAETRGKELPALLKETLEKQSGLTI